MSWQRSIFTDMFRAKWTKLPDDRKWLLVHHLLVHVILCLGTLGVHYFYVGKIGMGLLYLLTGGLFGIGWIVDIIRIIAGIFRDKDGFYLREWIQKSYTTPTSGNHCLTIWKNGRLTVKVPKNKVNEYRELFTGEGGLNGSVKAAWLTPPVAETSEEVE